MNKIPISQVVLCEGRYDKIKLSSVIEGEILTLEGFAIFKNKEKRELISAIAKKKGIILITDSDSAGLVIRSHINNITKGEGVIHLYTPTIKGKEKRKPQPSKQGLLGVEGMEAELLRELFLPFANGAFTKKEEISYFRFYSDGFSGMAESKVRRARLIEKLKLPRDLSAKALLSAINMLYTLEEYERIIKEI